MSGVRHIPAHGEPDPAHGEPVEPWAARVLRQAQDERVPQARRFAGYAALFAIADAAGDVIRPGAFARAIAAARDRPVPLWWQHRARQPIGTVESLAEDARGLRVIARLDARSRAAAALARRQVSGLSFGYRARGWRPIPQGRLLEDIELIEVSLVTHPLQFGARVHFVI